MTADDGLRTWRLALVAFIVAGTLGALWRFSAIEGAPGDLRFPHIRHAHSHLMYFSWATPALMALMQRRVARRTGRAPGRTAQWTVLGAWALGLAATPFFLLHGYGTTPLFGRELPISGILSGLAIVPWVAFAVAHLRAVRGLPRDTALRAWDLALLFLGLAALSAWARAILAARGIDDLFWTTATVHGFLDWFSLGWFGLGVLGILYDGEDAEARGAVWWVTAGIPLSWLLTMPVAWVPGWARLLAGAGAVAMAMGFGLHARALWRMRGPAVALAIVAVAQFGLAVAPVASWGERMLLRVPYLHILLLGFVTLGLVAAAHREWASKAAWRPQGLAAAVLILLAGLVPLTGLWPTAWVGKWVLWMAAVTSLGPLLWAVATLVHSKCSSSHSSSSSSFQGS